MKVTFVNHSGEARALDAPAGLSLAELAVRNGVDGIEAECGFACSCGTCRVFVDPAWVARLPMPGIIESDMLETFEDPQPNARLACQIVLADGMDGLVVRTPKIQGD